LRGKSTIDEAMRDEDIVAATRGALSETGELLVQKHGFDAQTMVKYREKILQRFANPLLSDQVTRVARNPIRKLSPEDRLVGPAMQCAEKGIVPENLALAIAAALRFDDPADSEAQRIQADVQQAGWKQVLPKYTGIPLTHPLSAMILGHLESR